MYLYLKYLMYLSNTTPLKGKQCVREIKIFFPFRLYHDLPMNRSHFITHNKSTALTSRHVNKTSTHVPVPLCSSPQAKRNVSAKETEFFISPSKICHRLLSMCASVMYAKDGRNTIESEHSHLRRLL